MTAVFPDMLQRSIPQYAAMRAAVTDLAILHAKAGSDVLDLGCSRGDAMQPLVDQFGATLRYIGLDVSGSMVAAARERFAGLIACGMVDIREHDLRRGLPCCKASVILAVLTLQFVPIEHRQRVVAEAYARLMPGGVMIVVEKILGVDAASTELQRDLYWRMKQANGYSPDAIRTKAESLEGVLVPLTAAWNEQMLAAAGFHVEPFWRWMNFAGWLAKKE